MKIRADEHVSPEIVDAVNRISLSSGWTLDHVYDSGDGGTDDDHWITRFSNMGGEAILSADHDFTKTPPQVAAVFSTGMKVIHLPPRWGNADCHLQAAFILLWWPRIEEQLRAMRPRECYRPEWNVKSDSGQFKKVEIDFAKAHKKLKKAARRAG